MKKKVWDTEGVLTEYGKSVQAEIDKFVHKLLVKHATDITGDQLRGLEYLWAQSIAMPVALIVAGRRGDALAKAKRSARKVMKGGK